MRSTFGLNVLTPPTPTVSSYREGAAPSFCQESGRFSVLHKTEGEKGAVKVNKFTLKQVVIRVVSFICRHFGFQRMIDELHNQHNAKSLQNVSLEDVQ